MNNNVDTKKKLGVNEISKIRQKDVLDAIEMLKHTPKYYKESEKYRSKKYPIYEVAAPEKQYPSKYVAMLAYNKIVYGKYMGNNEGGYRTENFSGGKKVSNGIAKLFITLLDGTKYRIDEGNPRIDERDLYPDEINIVCYEGAKKTILVNKYERDKKAREECIKLKGLRCDVCEILLEEVYGSIAEGFIHIHHLVPLNKIGKKYKVNPQKDLVPVCPNCHAMLHRKLDGKELSTDELRKEIKRRRQMGANNV